MGRGKRTSLKKAATYIILITFLVWTLFPIYWCVSTALKQSYEWLAVPPVFFSQKPTTIHYEIVLFHEFGWYLSQERYDAMKEYFFVTRSQSGLGGKTLALPPYFNSLIISASTALLCIFLGTFSGYSLARFNMRGKSRIASWILSVRMFPPIVAVLPLFMMFRWAKLLDTHFALILVYTTFNLPFAVWMMMGFFREIPVEIEESAFIDGCSSLGAFRRIALPLTKTGLAATGIFCFLFSFNEYLLALILSATQAVTAPVSLALWVSNLGPEWGEVFAYTTLILIPPLILFWLIQKHMVRGLTFGAVRR